MNKMFTDVSPAGMALAIEADVQDASVGMAKSPLCEINEAPDATWILTGMPNHDYNKVVRSELEPENADARVEEILAYYSSKNVPMSWWLGPSSLPVDLGTRLEVHGMIRAEDSVGMALDIHEVNEDHTSPPKLVVERIRDDASLAEFVHVSTMNFNLPNAMEPRIHRVTINAGYGPSDRFSHYLGLLDGEPVATATGYKGERVVSIQNITTSPQARRRGVGTAVTMAPILEAREIGYRIASLQASKMGYPMYEKMGFREYMRFKVYVREIQSP